MALFRIEGGMFTASAAKTVHSHEPERDRDALRFFFTVTLGWSEVTDHMPSVREPRKLPVVLSPKEVARFLDAAPKTSCLKSSEAGAHDHEIINNEESGRLLLDLSSHTHSYRIHKVFDDYYADIFGLLQITAPMIILLNEIMRGDQWRTIQST
jgi:hypothetical protein